MIKLYGIPNCDTVKKARSWLTENGIKFEFVDFKKNAPTADLIDGWLNQAALEILLNKRGTTWRKLDKDAQESATTKEGAIALDGWRIPASSSGLCWSKKGRFMSDFQ